METNQIKKTKVNGQKHPAKQLLKATLAQTKTTLGTPKSWLKL